MVVLIFRFIVPPVPAQSNPSAEVLAQKGLFWVLVGIQHLPGTSHIVHIVSVVLKDEG